ncbi:MAG: DUF1592 domain-containing protein [Planctomycetaceae bacterium]|nr:MAG: DUF1592 domain-containing protein [Planctomycetaceae bacterium]
MTFFRALAPSLVVCCLLLGVSGGRCAAAPLSENVEALLRGYCVTCHGPENASGGFRLGELATDWDDLEAERRWVTVLDKLDAGEMPPESEEQPQRELLAAATAELRSGLHAASLRRQQRDGRVPVRRLNGFEYEQTLHDLLGINIPLREWLPEDNSTAGFDTVSAGLDLSAMHFLRYQEAASLAIDAVVPIHPPIRFNDRRTGLEMTEKGPNFRQGLGRTCVLSGDTLVFYTKLPRYGLCATAAVPTAGRYRVRLKAAAVGEDNRSISVGLMTVMQSGREEPVLKQVQDIPSGEPQVHEFECDLIARQAFVVNLLTTWDIRRFKRPIEEYTGPGLLVEWMEIEGPIDPFPPPRYASLFDGVPLKPRSVVRAEASGGRVPVISDQRTFAQWHADPLVPVSESPAADAERLIRAFLPRAFRRPVTEKEARHFVDATLRQLDRGRRFDEAMRYGYQLILASPSFLLLLDTGDDTTLSDHALASRLSYFLWSTAPDEELLSLADRGVLSRPEVLREQVDRMLDSSRAQQFIRNFTGQWLDLRRIDFTIPDPLLYSDFDPLLQWSMPLETEAFFEEVLRQDMSLLNFVDSDWSMLNERLAILYGVDGVDGSRFRKVTLPTESRRGGVMTQASVLKVTADGTRTSPVLRGTWVLDRIVGTPPAPPPPDIPPIEPDIRGAETIRQQLERHRDTPACASCHRHIDPPGFALESFDPIGNWRDFYRVATRTTAGLVELPYGSGRAIYRGPDVELGGQTADGHEFRNIDDYKRLLLRDPDQIARNLTSKLLVYATGADIQFADREVVEEIVVRLRDGDYGFRQLVHEVVQSRLFLMK